MSGELEGKVALVTGGASGIGRACAERLAQEGAFVVVTDVQDDKGADAVAAIAAAGGKARYLSHDVTSEDAWYTVTRIGSDVRSWVGETQSITDPTATKPR